MKPFRERNPVTIGAISILVLTIFLIGALRAQDLPIIGGGTSYTADFSEVGGLKQGDEVRIAGVRVGDVQSISLDNDTGTVAVKFRIKTDSKFGSQSKVAIKIKTLLGDEYLDLEPAGVGQMPASSRSLDYI